MTEQELREKIVNIAISTVWKDCYGDEVVIDRAVAEQFADVLIAAGLTFDKTAERAFKLYLKYNLECERCVDRMNGVCNASAEEKADCANRTLSLYKEYTEKELEGKDE